MVSSQRDPSHYNGCEFYFSNLFLSILTVCVSNVHLCEIVLLFAVAVVLLSACQPFVNIFLIALNCMKGVKQIQFTMNVTTERRKMIFERRKCILQ